jgi:hypothetical protein
VDGIELPNTIYHEEEIIKIIVRETFHTFFNHKTKDYFRQFVLHDEYAIRFKIQKICFDF